MLLVVHDGFSLHSKYFIKCGCFNSILQLIKFCKSQCPWCWCFPSHRSWISQDTWCRRFPSHRTWLSQETHWMAASSRTTIKSRCLILHQVAFIVVLYWIRSWTLEQRSTVKSSGHDGSALGQDTSSTLPSPLKGTSSCRSRGAFSCHVK